MENKVVCENLNRKHLKYGLLEIMLPLHHIAWSEDIYLAKFQRAKMSKMVVQ